MAKPHLNDRHPLVRWAKENFISMTALSKKLGISRTAIHYWETGHRAPCAFSVRLVVDMTKGAVRPAHLHDYWLSKQGASND